MNYIKIIFFMFENKDNSLQIFFMNIELYRLSDEKYLSIKLELHPEILDIILRKSVESNGVDYNNISNCLVLWESNPDYKKIIYKPILAGLYSCVEDFLGYLFRVVDNSEVKVDLEILYEFHNEIINLYFECRSNNFSKYPLKNYSEIEFFQFFYNPKYRPIFREIVSFTARNNSSKFPLYIEMFLVLLWMEVDINSSNDIKMFDIEVLLEGSHPLSHEECMFILSEIQRININLFNNDIDNIDKSIIDKIIKYFYIIFKNQQFSFSELTKKKRNVNSGKKKIKMKFKRLKKNHNVLWFLI